MAALTFDVLMDLILLIIELAIAASAMSLLWYCALTKLGPTELVQLVSTRWKNRRYYEGEPIPRPTKGGAR